MPDVELEHSITIKRSPEDVYAFVADPENATKWRVGLVEAKQVGEEMGVGTVVKEKVEVLGRKLNAEQRITAFEPGQRRSLEVKLGPLPIELDEVYEATEEGTKLSVTGRTQLTGVQKMMNRVVLGQVKKQLEKELQNIKDVLEQA